MSRNKHFILSSTFPRAKSIVDRPQVRAIQCPAQFLCEEEKLFIATRNFVDFLVESSMFPIGADWQQENSMARLKNTDFVSNVNETMLFILYLTQIDGVYCVSYWGTHIPSLSSLTESFSDRMQIFLAPPNDCFSNWNGFVIVESFNVSTAYHHTHRNPNPHFHLNHTQSVNNNCLFSLLSLYFFHRRKNDVFAQGLLWNYLHLWGKKSVMQATNGALFWLWAVGFFSFVIKINIVNNQWKQS